MVNYTASFSPTTTSTTGSGTLLGIGVDLSRDPVFFDGDVRESVAFAQLMLALAEVVKLDTRWRAGDNSAYQEWVSSEYVKELAAETRMGAERISELLAQREVADREHKALRAKARQLVQQLTSGRRKYYSWLYKNNRELWLALDPIVSVHPEKTYFEAFSADESVYARVTLPHAVVDFSEPPQPGTTNIDFSLGLEREFSRARSYRPLHLSVGIGAVEVSTSDTSVREKKIDLPESWVRGLVEVQAAMSLASVEVVIDSWRLADVVAFLEGRREKEGPRSLLFELTPGEPVTVLVEPWNERFALTDEAWEGQEPQSVKVWGRRRLRILRNLLTAADSVTLRLLGSGMPSFWSVELAGIGLTVGLSGWSSQDWASHARFSAFVPQDDTDLTELHQAGYLLKESYALDVTTVATTLNLTPAQARSLLQTLCQRGVAMFDPETNRYLARELFPDGQFTPELTTGTEESHGVKLSELATFTHYTDQLSAEERTVSTVLSHDGSSNSVTIRFDNDGRAVHGECSCSFFRYNKLKKGPCRHMVALVVKSA